MFKALFENISPKNFYYFSSKIIPWAFVTSVVFIGYGLYLGLFVAPSDYQQGDAFRIIYVHVPSAWLALMTYVIMTIYSIAALAFKTPFGFVVNTAIAPIGATFTLVCIITGSMWGKPMWGTWWVWDARLTSTLVLLLLYLGIIALRNALEEKGNDGRPCAVLALVGLVNLPIIKYSVDWWFTLHQPASFTLTEKPKMPPEMWIPLLLMAAGYYLFVFSVWTSRIRNEIISRERKTAWAKAWAGPQ